MLNTIVVMDFLWWGWIKKKIEYLIKLTGITTMAPAGRQGYLVHEGNHWHLGWGWILHQRVKMTFFLKPTQC